MIKGNLENTAKSAYHEISDLLISRYVTNLCIKYTETHVEIQPQDGEGIACRGRIISQDEQVGKHKAFFCGNYGVE